MQLNPAEISELIKSRIEGLVVSADIRNEGTVVSVTDGICRVHGLSEAMQGEMLEFPAAPDGSPTYGLTLNLERDSVGAVILGEYEHISEGDTVKCTGRILEVPIGTIESIAFRPVCIGWLTLWRAITPGAIFSIGADSLALIGPLPSIGAPSALTTRPFSSGPIGTSRMRPVHLTVSPSEMCS